MKFEQLLLSHKETVFSLLKNLAEVRENLIRGLKKMAVISNVFPNLEDILKILM